MPRNVGGPRTRHGPETLGLSRCELRLGSRSGCPRYRELGVPQSRAGRWAVGDWGCPHPSGPQLQSKLGSFALQTSSCCSSAGRGEQRTPQFGQNDAAAPRGLVGRGPARRAPGQSGQGISSLPGNVRVRVGRRQRPTAARAGWIPPGSRPSALEALELAGPHRFGDQPSFPPYFGPARPPTRCRLFSG